MRRTWEWRRSVSREDGYGLAEGDVGAEHVTGRQGGKQSRSGLMKRIGMRRLDTLGWNGEKVSFGPGLWADDGEPERVVGDTHDKAVDGRRSRTNVLIDQWEPFGISGNGAITGQVARPDANAAANGGTRTTRRRAGHRHGTEGKTRRKMSKTRQRQNLVFGRDRAG